MSFALGLLIAASACDRRSAEQRSIPVSVSDSTGIPVYSLSYLPPWNDSSFVIGLDLERAIPTGGLSPSDEPLVYRPQGYARLADGRLVVLDGGSDRLVVLAADEATVEARFGPTGQGPGEILSANSLLWPGPASSVWVLDPGNRRLSRFLLDGSVEEERAIDILGMAGLAVQRPGTFEPFFWKVFMGGAAGNELTDSIGRFESDAGRVVFFAPMAPRTDERRTNTDQPPVFAPMGWFSPVGDGVVVGRNDTGRFRHYSETGELIGIIDVPMQQTPIDQAEESAILQEFYGVVRGSVLARRRVADAYPLYHIMWPVNDSLFALQQSHRSTLAGEPRIPSAQIVWRVFSTRGAYAGSIIFPEGVAQPYWIDGDRVVATRRDPLGVATIESYRLRFPRGRP